MILAVLQDWFWLIWAVGTGVTLIVISAWNYASMRANRRDHADVSRRLGVLEKLVDHLYDRLFPHGKD